MSFINAIIHIQKLFYKLFQIKKCVNHLLIPIIGDFGILFYLCGFPSHCPQLKHFHCERGCNQLKAQPFLQVALSFNPRGTAF